MGKGYLMPLYSFITSSYELYSLDTGFAVVQRMPREN